MTTAWRRARTASFAPSNSHTQLAPRARSPIRPTWPTTATPARARTSTANFTVVEVETSPAVSFEVNPPSDSAVQLQANSADDSSDAAAAAPPPAAPLPSRRPEVAALGAMLQQLSVIQGAATDAERDAGYDALAGMLDEVQKKQPPPFVAAASAR